jgi:predicted MPP superfamily phosphohydrolase
MKNKIFNFFFIFKFLGIFYFFFFVKKFFSTHPVYSTLPSGTLGTDSLTNRLTEILYKHIRKYMPELIKKISGLIKVK